MASKGVDPVEESVDEEIDRGIAAAAERPWTPVIENFDPDRKVFGSVETRLGNRHGEGHLEMEFNEFIYLEYGNVVRVAIIDGRNAETVFVKLEDLLAAVQWMRRVYPVEKND